MHTWFWKWQSCIQIYTLEVFFWKAFNRFHRLQDSKNNIKTNKPIRGIDIYFFHFFFFYLNNNFSENTEIMQKLYFFISYWHNCEILKEECMTSKLTTKLDYIVYDEPWNVYYLGKRTNYSIWVSILYLAKAKYLVRYCFVRKPCIIKFQLIKRCVFNSPTLTRAIVKC